MDITGFKSKDGTVHKYDYNALANKPVIPEGSGSVGSGDQGCGLTDAQIAALENLFKIAAYTENAAEEYAAFRAAFARSGSSGEDGGDEPGGDAPDVETGGEEVIDSEWVSTVEIGDKYVTAALSNTTGEVNTSGTGWYVSDLIEVPDGATTWSRVTSRTSDHGMVWYDGDGNFLSGTNASYVGTGQYGNGYTDGDGVVWNLIPMGAKYVRVSWRTSATYTSVSFKHNTLMTETVTPEYGKVYYYTVPNGAYVFGDYLRCDGMAYAQARPVKRRQAEFYDENHSLLSKLATTNNLGNNLAIPAGAKYIRLSNSSTADDKGADGGLIAFTVTEVTTW